jgi:hypothetical protein
MGVVCLICSETIAVLKEYNTARLHISKHKEKCNNYVGALRRDEVAASGSGLESR